MYFQSEIGKKEKCFSISVLFYYWCSLLLLESSDSSQGYTYNALECVYYNKCQTLNFLQMHFWDFTFALQFWSITYLDFFWVHIKCTIRALWTFLSNSVPEHSKRLNKVQPFSRLKKVYFQGFYFHSLRRLRNASVLNRRCLQSLDKCQPDV